MHKYHALYKAAIRFTSHHDNFAPVHLAHLRLERVSYFLSKTELRFSFASNTSLFGGDEGFLDSRASDISIYKFFDALNEETERT